ncbi:hypothetical protein OG609_15510 [Streptomyces sp. NBC_01224]|uniref:PIN domain-containing protein n=1 Tax=unclassified Streptomyces TaxID=2593676 RepID=UPI002E16496E|nr:hypothetical protein OG609_15510 [Streptomyces sp. NBC_01224]
MTPRSGLRTALASTATPAARLPAHHRDPFDRILIAQAQTEGMTVLTRDKWIPSYDVQVMPV